MIISRTAKVAAKVHKALSAAQKSVHLEIDELLRTYNEPLPELELIFCPLVFPEIDLDNWKEKTRRSKTENWISFEKWIDFEPFLPPANDARATYARWVKATVSEAKSKYSELEAVSRLLDRLTD
jgi:hypothetical protein